MSKFSNFSGFLGSGKVILAANALGYLGTIALSTHKLTDLVGCGTFGIAAVLGYLSMNEPRPPTLNL